MNDSNEFDNAGATVWLQALHCLLNESRDLRWLYWKVDHSFAIRAVSEVPFEKLRQLGIARMSQLIRKLEQFGFQRVNEEKLFGEERKNFYVFIDYSGAFVPFDSSAIHLMRPVYTETSSLRSKPMSTTSLVDPLQEEDDKAPLEKYETLRPRQPRARNSIGLDSPISRLEIRRRLEDHKAFLLEPTVPFDSPPRFLLSPPSIPLPRASTPPRYRDDLFDSFCSSSSSSSHSMDHTPALSRSTSSDSSFSPFHHGSPQFSPWAPPWSNGFETSTSKTHRSKPLQLSSDLESIPWIAPPHDKPLDVSQSAEIGLGFLDFESFLPSSSDRSYHSFNPNEGDYQNQFISFETTNFSGPFLPSSHSAPLPSNHDAPRSYYSQRGEGYDHFQSFQQPSELIRPHALRIPHPYHSSPRPLPPHRNHSLAVDVGRLEQLASTSLSFDFSPDEPSRSHSEPIRVNAPPQAQSSFNDQPQSLTSSSSTRRISANASLEKILNPPVFSPPGDTSSIPFGHPHAF